MSLLPAVATGLATALTVEEVKEIFGEKSDKHQELLERIVELLEEDAERQVVTNVDGDLYKVVTLAKFGVGPSLVLNPEHRAYTKILFGVSTPLLITSIIGTYIQTITPFLWTAFDIPDNTPVQLDTSAATATVQAYVRYTNVAP